jgi:23S rRNA pseudouridine2605 synthase
MSKSPFKKFMDKPMSGAKKKEQIRQEKRVARQEKNAYFEELKKQGRGGVTGTAKRGSGGPKPVAAKPGAVKTETSGKELRAKAEAVMPLNKFLAHAGVSSRRDAAEIIKNGRVKVKGQVVSEPGFKVTESDDIRLDGRRVFVQVDLVYILINKPKDTLTTTEDPQGRNTVLQYIKGATAQRVYPVGRLDRNTTGVLLLTNDGELAQKLTHPRYEIKKIYEVTLDRPLTAADAEKVSKGVTLEDGFIAPDDLAFPDSKNKALVGIEIHSGRNRIVRRIFEHLGYKVKNLDRVMFGNLTKKNVDRGKWRYLSDKEIRNLKFLNASQTRKKGDK